MTAAASTAATDASRPHRPWGWFVSWMLVGAADALAVIGILTIGILVLPVAVIATVLLARRASSLRGLPGVAAGLGLPPLYVAWLNHAGPGQVCVAVSGGESCTQEMSPWPWVAVGVALIVGGIVVLIMRSRDTLASSQEGHSTSGT